MPYHYKYENRNFYIVPSSRKNKKYDVYENQKYLLSYGDKRYQQFYDKFGHYKNLNHGDITRRKSYRARHRSEQKKSPDTAGFWSDNFLW